MKREMYAVNMLVHEIYYCHGQHEAILTCTDECGGYCNMSYGNCDTHYGPCAYDCASQHVVNVRTMLHFVHSWQRDARKQMLRYPHHVLLLSWSKHLPESIGYQIYACLRSQAQLLPQAARDSQALELVFRQPLVIEYFHTLDKRLQAHAYSN